MNLLPPTDFCVVPAALSCSESHIFKNRQGAPTAPKSSTIRC